MGCDIHGYVEREYAKKWIMMSDCFEWENYQGKKEYVSEVYIGRNYELFALLADVRNYNSIKPISSPKGIPSDASHGYLNEIDQMGGDDHSHSYFTLEELKNIPYDILNQEVDDNSLIIEKDENGNITGTCSSTTGKHLGTVGKRKLFKLFQTEGNPITEIIEKLDEIRKEYNLDDNQIRIVFFFDN